MSHNAEEYRAYLLTRVWRERRDKAIKAAGGRCQLCNSEKYLNVHHRTYARLGKELPNDLTVLCRACHEHFHGITGGGARRLSKAPRDARTKAPLVAVWQATRDQTGVFTAKRLKRIVPGASIAEIQESLRVLARNHDLYEKSPGQYVKRTGAFTQARRRRVA